jgi:hypothetical protein
MYAATEHHEGLARLALAQLGVLHRDQLRRLEVSANYVEAQIKARRWTAVGANVVLLQNADHTQEQLMWLATLDAGPAAALGSHTSLELAGFAGFPGEARTLHLIVERGARVTPLPGVRVHESRRLHPEGLLHTRGLPRTPTARSAVDAGAWQPHPRFACLMMAAVVQQRLTTPAQLFAALEAVGRVRHRAYMRLAVQDVSGGAQTLGEQDLARACRRFRLVPPTRQGHRRDAAGRSRYLDAEWQLASGEIVVLEVDGSHHQQVGHWEADMRRERSIVVSGRRVLRATNFELRLDPELIVADLKALGVPTLPDLSDSQLAIAS